MRLVALRARVLPYLSYPLLMTLCVVVTAAARDVGVNKTLAMLLGVGLLIALVAWLERVSPYRSDWGVRSADLKADVMHSIVSNGVPSAALEGLLKAVLVQLAFTLRTQRGIDLWPDAWPLAAQVLLALFAAEVGFYAVHRFFHEIDYVPIWKWHAVHHSIVRMYFLAGTRTHPVQVLFSFGATVAILWILGVPDEVIYWKTVLHTANGIMQHCNIDVRLGVFNWLISGPELHRWHHSMQIEESNNNYGNNLSVIDVLLGSFYLPQDRRAPLLLGLLPKVKFDNSFVGHMLIPMHYPPADAPTVPTAATARDA